MNIEYSLNEKANPYEKISDKIKIWDLIYNKSKNKIERVD